jgi:hypothetical protein
MNNDTFYSTERLVEFGMSMAIAQQMVASMNTMMANTAVPNPRNNEVRIQSGSGLPERVYYAAFEGKQAGPFSETEIARLIGDKKITRETLLWYPGLEVWKTAENIPEILRLVALMPPAIET